LNIVLCLLFFKGSTPLHDAAGQGNKEVVELLISAGASLSVENKDENEMPYKTSDIFSLFLVTIQSVQTFNGCHQIIFCYITKVNIFCFRKTEKISYQMSYVAACFIVLSNSIRKY
jgi:hypothetical protein